MMKRILALCLLLSGCSLYLGDDDDDCKYEGGADDVGYGGTSQGYRDPYTGTCNYSGGGGGWTCGCNDYCTDEGYNDGGPVVPTTAPNEGLCETSCDALSESACIATPGCHAAYLDEGLDSLVPYTAFLGCWATPFSESQQAASCTGLDAQSCSTYDNCSMVYYEGYNTSNQFEQCIAETATCGSTTCGAGSHCEQECTCDSLTGCENNTCSPVCVPDMQCDQIDCGTGYQCVEECYLDSTFGCTATCVPTGNDPGQCTGSVTCDATPPVCPANSTAGIANGCYTGFCIPNAECGTHDPGQCYAAVTCGTAAPSCPTGTLPGVTNGCYSGYCIPTYGCEIQACEALGTENDCLNRSDCEPVYTGTDCTCTPQGCTCATETYSKCESVLMPL